MAMTKRERNLVMITIVVALTIGSYTLIKLMSSDMADSDVSMATQARFEDLFEKINNVEDQKTRNNQLRIQLGNPVGSFIKQDEIHKFMAEMEKVAGQSNFQIKNYSFKEDSRAQPVPKLEVQLNGQCKFEQLIPYLDNLRKADYMCQVTSMRCGLVDQNQDNLDVQLTITTYVIDATPQRSSPTSIAST